MALAQLELSSPHSSWVFVTALLGFALVTAGASKSEVSQSSSSGKNGSEEGAGGGSTFVGRGCCSLCACGGAVWGGGVGW